MSNNTYRFADHAGDYLIFDRKDKSPFKKQLDVWIRNGVVSQLRRMIVPSFSHGCSNTHYVMVAGNPQDIQFLNMMYEDENKF